MLEEEHIFTIKTKDATNVADIRAGGSDIVISGLNVLKDQIRIGDFIFVVFGGDKPKGWKPGLVGIAHISKTPFDEGYDGGKNFRVAIDVDVYFEPSIVRGDLVTYPDTFDTIGIGPITKWEPNQAITSVPRRNAIALLHAICDLRSDVLRDIKALLGSDFALVEQPVARYVLSKSRLGESAISSINLEETRRNEFYDWMLRIENKSQKTAKDTSGTYLPSISDDLAPRTASVWHGLREYLYNEKPAKKIYAVDSLAELDELYGGLDRIFQQDSEAGDLDPLRFKECKDWVDSPNNHNSVRAAWGMYKRFMQWREGQHKKQEESRLILPAVDRLSIALKIFAEKRYEGEWQGKTNSEEHQSIYSMSDLTPEKLAERSLDDFYNDFLLKVWVFKNGGSRKYAQLDEAEKTAYRQFVVDLKTQLKGFDAYFPPNTKCPAGMGVGMLTELMMRFWPKSCCSYNKLLIHDALMTLGMAEGDFVWPKTPSIYQDFMGKCATILRKMEQMKLPRRPEPDNAEPPDYITVNEFLWFVHDYKNLIKEEVMKKQMKEVHADVISAAGKKLALNADSKEDLLMLRLMSSLRAKPFVILAGHSGTGKSRIVRKLAYMTCNVKELQDKDEGPLNFCMVQVKPNWHDSADLLGYRSAIKDNEYIGTKLVKFLFRAYAYPNTPFFLCLDEMNLAPVEQYFAEFLSAMESLKPVDKDDVDGKGEFTSDRVIDLDPDQDSNLYDLGCEWTAAYNWVKAHGLTIPKNLFVVGTVNMDETTCQFSRKVLDRAMTIEMTDASFADYGKVAEPSFDDRLDAGIIEKLIERPVRIKKLDEDDAKADSTLMAVQRCLEKTPFAVAFRFANEYMLYKRAIKEFDPDGTMKVDSLDHVVLMKVLPRISGEKGYVANIFIGSEDIKNKLESPTPDSLLGIFKEATQLSHGKMIDILSRKASYLTFWP